MSDWEAAFSGMNDPHAFSRIGRAMTPAPEIRPVDPWSAMKVIRPARIPSPEDETGFFLFNCPADRVQRAVHYGRFELRDSSDAAVRPADTPVGAKTSLELWRDRGETHRWPTPSSRNHYGYEIPHIAASGRWVSALPPTRLRDIDHLVSDNVFLVSARFLAIILRFDAEAVVHHPVDIVFKDGSRPPEQMSMLAIRREIWGVDAERSVLCFVPGRLDSGPGYDEAPLQWCPSRNGPATIRTDLPASCHLFRQLVSVSLFSAGVFRTSYDTYISRELRDALLGAKPKLRTWTWKHPANILRYLVEG